MIPLLRRRAGFYRQGDACQGQGGDGEIGSRRPVLALSVVPGARDAYQEAPAAPAARSAEAVAPRWTTDQARRRFRPSES